MAIVGLSDGGKFVTEGLAKVKEIGKLNALEKRLVKRIMETTRININEPFTAEQLLNAIEADLLDSGCTMRYFPNKYKMNYLLRKTKMFICTKAGDKGVNVWVKAHKLDANMEAWVKALKKSNIERPFTTKAAYEVICASVTLRGKIRNRVPANTNELAQKIRGCKRIKRVNTKSDARYVALWDFVD